MNINTRLIICFNKTLRQNESTENDQTITASGGFTFARSRPSTGTCNNSVFK